MWHVLVLQAAAVFGVVDPVQPFVPVATPSGLTDPCRDPGAPGAWVPMSARAAPASIHDQNWLDSAAVWSGGRRVVATRSDGVWHGSAFDPCANAWAALPATRDSPPRADGWRTDDRDRPLVARRDPRDSSYDFFDHVSVWDETRKAWTTVDARNRLAPRTLYALAVAGRRALVWGGWSAPRPAARALGDGAVLDLGTKRWKPMSAAHAPSPRFLPTAVVWTGSRLLVWGGRFAPPDATRPTQTVLLADGASYDPVADRWTAMSTADAPTARTDAIVAWTGRKLVVYGGAAAIGDPVQLRDGAVYDPAADRWTRLGAPPGDVALPRANVGPMARILVTSDDRVLFLPEGLSTIAVLDAERARWSTLPVGALAPRTSFRAFLVGRRLLVWGGMRVISEPPCPPPQPNLPLCDPVSVTAPRNDGAMLVLPPR